MPLVSIIVPTKNSSEFLESCLQSIKDQTYQAIELIVVDNNSTDTTQEIARRFTDKVFTKGPERSAQRNFGASQATGEYVVFIDSDMMLSREVIASCVIKASSNSNIAGIIIPEESFGVGFWAQCKKLERSFYVGVSWMEAARFFKKSVFDQVHGYNIEMVSGEDWDLSRRVEKIGKVARINDYIYHNEGQLRLLTLLKKKYYYAKKFSVYLKNSKDNSNIKNQTGIVKRFLIFFRQPLKLFRNPILGLGMLFMKISEFGVGGIGIFL
jgi:glycosyltransferase involved in cell wall biosynthesis